MERTRERVDVLTITPLMAKEWLSSSRSNRVLSEPTVQKYANQMLRGEWILNGSTIIFDVDGRLIDGQHRLAACVRSGVEFLSVVVEGVVESSFSTIDIGKTRTVPDLISIDCAGTDERSGKAAKTFSASLALYEAIKCRIRGVSINIPQRFRNNERALYFFRWRELRPLLFVARKIISEIPAKDSGLSILSDASRIAIFISLYGLFTKEIATEFVIEFFTMETRTRPYMLAKQKIISESLSIRPGKKRLSAGQSVIENGDISLNRCGCIGYTEIRNLCIKYVFFAFYKNVIGGKYNDTSYSKAFSKFMYKDLLKIEGAKAPSVDAAW